MRNDYVAISPSQDTVNYLQQVLGACPFEVSSSQTWHIPVLVAEAAIDVQLLDHRKTFMADPIHSELWYDDATGRSDLMIIFNSVDIKARHAQLLKLTGAVSEHDTYVPAMAIRYDFPPLSQANRSFINSLNMTLRQDPTVFGFSGECLLDSGGYTPHAKGMTYFTRRMIG